MVINKSHTKIHKKGSILSYAQFYKQFTTRDELQYDINLGTICIVN